MSDIERISATLKSRRNPLWKKTDRKIAFILLFTAIPVFIVALAGAIVFDNTVMTLGPIFSLIFALPLVTGIITKKYWRCPGCGNALPNTGITMGSTFYKVSGCFPGYVEICPKCGFSLVEGKPPLTEAEILEDRRKLRRRMAGIFGALGIVLFIEFLIVLVLVKKGEI